MAPTEEFNSNGPGLQTTQGGKKCEQCFIPENYPHFSRCCWLVIAKNLLIREDVFRRPQHCARPLTALLLILVKQLQIGSWSNSVKDFLVLRVVILGMVSH